MAEPLRTVTISRRPLEIQFEVFDATYHNTDTHIILTNRVYVLAIFVFVFILFRVEFTFQ